MSTNLYDYYHDGTIFCVVNDTVISYGKGNRAFQWFVLAKAWNEMHCMSHASSWVTVSLSGGFD